MAHSWFGVWSKPCIQLNPSKKVPNTFLELKLEITLNSLGNTGVQTPNILHIILYTTEYLD
jgi:hypothetical protein